MTDNAIDTIRDSLMHGVTLTPSTDHLKALRDGLKPFETILQSDKYGSLMIDRVTDDNGDTYYELWYGGWFVKFHDYNNAVKIFNMYEHDEYFRPYHDKYFKAWDWFPEREIDEVLSKKRPVDN